MRGFATAAKKRVAFVGLGNMGMHMAKNLAARGFIVDGVCLTEEQAQKATALGIEPHDCIESACANLKGDDFVVTALPRTEDVE